MPSIQPHFAPNDALIVNHAAVVRIIEYTDLCATLEVRDGSENPPIAITIGPQWSDVLQDVRVRHRGTFVNEKCQPARRVRIEFRYPPSVDIRMHSFAGVRVRGATPF